MKIKSSDNPDIKISRAIVFYKLITGILELSLGLGISVFGKKIATLYNEYKAKEIFEDSHDTLIAVVDRISPFVMNHRGYLTFLLITLGIVKIIGAIGLLFDKEWGLDLLIILFIILLPFDLIPFLLHPSILKGLYLVINILITFYLIEFKPHQYFLRVKKTFVKISSKLKK